MWKLCAHPMDFVYFDVRQFVTLCCKWVSFYVKTNKREFFKRTILAQHLFSIKLCVKMKRCDHTQHLLPRFRPYQNLTQPKMLKLLFERILPKYIFRGFYFTSEFHALDYSSANKISEIRHLLKYMYRCWLSFLGMGWYMYNFDFWLHDWKHWILQIESYE